MTSIARSLDFSLLTPAETTRTASMSSPESVSSSTHSVGSSTAICRISMRFFSPREEVVGDAERRRLLAHAPQELRRGELLLPALAADRIEGGAQKGERGDA